MNSNVKLQPVNIPHVVEYRNKGMEMKLDQNSVLFGYTIRISKDVSDNIRNGRCKRSYDLIVNKQDNNMWCHHFRTPRGHSYIKITKRVPYRHVKDLYVMGSLIVTDLKQRSMILARQLKELSLLQDITSLKKGEKTTKMVNKQTQLELKFKHMRRYGCDPKEYSHVR